MCYIAFLHHQQIDGLPSIDPKYKTALQVQNMYIRVAIKPIHDITLIVIVLLS